MEDVIIDDRRQASAQAVNREKEATRGRPRRRRFRQYLVDLFVKSMMAASLIAINFVLFAEAGSYSIFTGAQQLNTEAMYILAAVFGLCFLISYLCSFSKFLQNLFTTSIFALFLLAVFNQFALFDKESVLSNVISTDGELGVLLSTGSHLVLTGILSLIFLIFLMSAGRLTQTYLLGILLFILGGLLAQGYMNPTPYNFRTSFDLLSNQDLAKETDDGKRFIHIAMPSLTSYSNLRSFINDKPGNEAYNKKIQTAMDAMLGFYVQNNFTLYQNAYLEGTNPFLNLTQSYNPVNLNQNPMENTLNNVLFKSYFDFDNIVSPTVYLKNNKLFDSFRKNKYHLKVYETRGIETCNVNNEKAVDKCIQKENVPFNLEQTNFSTLQKTYLLLIQWLESTGLITDFSMVNEGMKLIVPGLPNNQFSTKQLYVANSFKALDLLAKDISTDRGNNAYFVIMDMPAELFIYDSFCNLKPLSQWISADSANTVKKREAYAEQMTCLYGQLENFMQRLSNDYKLKKTVIVIEGLSAPQNITSTRTAEFAKQMRENKGVTMAIYDPMKDASHIASQICRTPDILKSYLYKKSACSQLHGMNLAEQPLKELMNNYNNEAITNAEIASGHKNFLKWYQKWAKTNNLNNNLDNLVEEETETPDNAQPQTENKDEPVDQSASLPETELKATPTAAAAEELDKETIEKPLSAAVKEEAQKNNEVVVDQNSQTNKTPSTVEELVQTVQKKQNDQQKDNAKINMEIKVIDTQAPEVIPGTHDVLPPFWEDDDNEVPPADK